ncbi:FecR family protein [Pedobacter sp. ok626]|uniref:FecR family protein n=1 Tax=Pedobacter sp. ok626 TaxID=1761882 RepID=UPI00087FAA0A|nr:FecR family protein [Pedobacter sp. ok626]SDL10199.1 FecR family protein [Pedobacter sp. ok626]
MNTNNPHQKEQYSRYVAQLIAGHIRKNLSESQQADLQIWLEDDPANLLIFKDFMDVETRLSSLRTYTAYDTESQLAKLEQLMGVADPETEVLKPALWLSWKRVVAVAAVVFIVFAAGMFFYIQLFVAKGEESQIQPMTNMATLQTANGKIMELSNQQEGILVGQDNITYSAGGKVIDDYPSATMLSLSVPVGGNYQVVLPDGTKVRLNAASQLKFPGKFSDSTRTVELEGEGYFEVTHDVKKPFLVKSGKQLVRVLGTVFNINTYSRQSTVKTTLINGSVRVINVNNQTSLLLKPGQQSIMPGDGISQKKIVDVAEEVAWIHKAISFNDKSFADIMDEISRSYGIEVVYEGPIPDVQLFGSINHSDNLSSVLKVLIASDVIPRLEGRKLIISKDRQPR